MALHIKALLHAAQAEEHPPPIGTLVDDAVRLGRQIRRHRAMMIAAWSIVVALAIVIALLRF